MALDREEISYAGMTSVKSDALGRPDGYGTWTVPSEVRLEHGQLAWSRGKGTPVTGRAGMLESFAVLADRPDEQILHFARRWGVLGICAEHDLPATHFPKRYLRWLDEDAGPFCQPAWAPGYWHQEPLDAWRRYSRQVQAILNIAAKLVRSQPEPAPAEMWASLTDGGLEHFVAGIVGGNIIPEVPRALADVAVQQRLLAMVVQGWLALGDVHVRFTWDSRPHFDLGEGSLFGALGLQLALAVAKRDGLAICDECGRFFIPRRQNKPGTPRRCPQTACRETAAKRESARRRRARDREGGT